MADEFVKKEVFNIHMRRIDSAFDSSRRPRP